MTQIDFNDLVLCSLIMIQENLNLMSGQSKVQITTKKFGEFIINKNEYAKN